VANPQLISIGDGVHLGDFCNIVPGFYSKGFTSAEIKVQDNTVVGSGSLLLPGSVLQENVILGALSVAPQGSVLLQGGVYVGAQSLTLVKMNGLQRWTRCIRRLLGTLRRTWPSLP
jgi:acetyltransferase-like isoleucine patch superfamily enzyme